MSNRLFELGREGFLDGTVDWDTGVMKVALVRGYTYNAAHKFVSDVTGAGGTLVATSSALTTKTVTNGVADADDVTFISVAPGAAITSFIIFQSSAVTGGADVAASAQRLVSFHDGKFLVKIATVASGGATTIVVDPLLSPIASAATMSRVTGTGTATITTNAAASANARSITTTALAGATVVDDEYEVVASGNQLPVTPDGNNVVLTFNNDATKIFKL